MTLEEKQIRATFLFAFKMGHKARKTTHNINNAFGPGTANETTMQWKHTVRWACATVTKV